jgi:hypothetical protein
MLAIFYSSNMRFRSDGDQMELERGFIGDKLKTSKRVFWAPVEVSHDHFLVTPPSHFTPRKVKGQIDALNRYQWNLYW